MSTKKIDAKQQQKRDPDLVNAELAMRRAAIKARDVARLTGTAVVVMGRISGCLSFSGLNFVSRIEKRIDEAQMTAHIIAMMGSYFRRDSVRCCCLKTIKNLRTQSPPHK